LYRHPLVDINNINVSGQKICSHFLVQIPRADAEIVTNKLPLIFFFINMLLLYFNVQYTNACFYWSLLEKKKATFSGICIQIKLIFFFSYEIAEFRIQELFEPLFKEKWSFSCDTQVSPHCLSFIIWFSRYRFSLYVL
jgi:hypothetical protein